MKCEQAIERMHQVLDGDLMEAGKRQELADHLSSCAECRRAETELTIVQQALNEMPSADLPEGALDEIWTRTSRSRGLLVYRWGSVAAAAVIALALLGVWQFGGLGDPGPSRTELDRAAEDVRLVLGLTARALDKTERAAFGEVLAEEVSPALNSIPIKLPGSSAERRKSGNEIQK
jgi:anti-sigma factor RsiW